MASGCCGGSACTCRITPGAHMSVSGDGSAANPFVLDTSIGLAVTDTITFDMGLTGAGSFDDPWTLSVAFAPTAKLDHLPDVSAPSPTNGQVLAWNSTLGVWAPTAPTTASAGAVQHDLSLVGDGSVGSPLGVIPNSARYIVSSPTGIGVTDAGINQMVRGFATAADRTAAVPAPDLNTLSILDDDPGRLAYYDGTIWRPVPGVSAVDFSGQLLQLSGPYTAGARLRQVVRQISTTADAAGVFDVLSNADLTTTPATAGVVTCQFQASGAIGFTVVINPVVGPPAHVTGTAYRLDDGTPFAGLSVTGTVLAVAYE